MTKEEIRQAGRRYLRAWLLGALRSGTIYYTIPHVARSGMSRRITLHRVVGGEVRRLFPSLPKGSEPKVYSAALDVVAKDWGFSFTHQSFVIGGCGMDMVFAQIDYLASIAGLGKMYWRRGDYVRGRYQLIKCPAGTTNDGRGGTLSFTNAVNRASL